MRKIIGDGDLTLAQYGVELASGADRLQKHQAAVDILVDALSKSGFRSHVNWEQVEHLAVVKVKKSERIRKGPGAAL